ncbi:MAG: GNAT family N-acetyltransferase, partial [Vicinamibacteria bacterium]
PNDLLVMDIALLPAEQRQGIGGRILSDLAAAADTEQRSMSLHVEPQNPALRLYQRLGFRVEEDVGVYVRMVRPPGGIS